MTEVYTFDVTFRGDRSAGMLPYNETVTVIVETDSGDAPEFRDYMCQAIREWFDGSSVQSRTDPRSLFAAAPELLEACKLDAANHDAIYRFVRHLERALDGTHQQAVADTLLELANKLDAVRDVRRAAIQKAGA